MNFKQSFKLAIKSLKASKMRSFLTMLGIVIGVAAVIILVSLVAGFSADLAGELQGMGTNLIMVYIMGNGASNRMVTVDEMQQLVEDNPDIFLAMTPEVNGTANLKVGAVSEDNVNILGVNHYYGYVRNTKLSTGRVLQYIDVARRQKVCIIGQYQANKFFPGIDPVGEKIKLNGNTFTVIGVLEEQADAKEYSMDDQVIIPYTVLSGITGNAYISTLSFSAVNTEAVNYAQDIVGDYLYDIYGREDAYYILNQADIMASLDKLTATLTLILVGIAGISLLVGGIGIMNIMLVSVTERTREIGIRKSLGGKRRDIMRQFVIEAATTSLIGGVVGIIVGIATAYAAGKLFDLTIIFSVFSILIAAGVSIAIGIIFGYFPAAKAAKLHPIEALRHE